ncbi:hypothetical protein Ndes2526B_g04496 [Nannochloris sp. 'desiccata']
MQEPGSSIPVKCWACCRKSEAPIYHGMAVSIIKCWYCGALIEDIQLEGKTGGGGGDRINNYMSDITNNSDGNSSLPVLNQRTKHHQTLGYAMVAFVFFLVTIVAGGGICIALPDAVSFTPLSPALPFLQIIAGILYLFILSTYISIIASHPGPVRLVGLEARTAGEAIGQGALNDWRWCKLCRQGKPPTAHHCRRCAICVQDLDHHCLFTANSCIGAGNMKPFLRFLYLVLLGCIFAFTAAAVMGWRNRVLIVKHTLATWHRPLLFNSLLLHALTFVWRWVLTTPLQLAGWALSFTLSFSTGVGVALLLHRQIKLKYRKSTVLGELQRRRQELQAAMAGEGRTGLGAPGGEFGQDAVHNRDVCKDKSM